MWEKFYLIYFLPNCLIYIIKFKKRLHNGRKKQNETPKTPNTLKIQTETLYGSQLKTAIN